MQTLVAIEFLHHIDGVPNWSIKQLHWLPSGHRINHKPFVLNEFGRTLGYILAEVAKKRSIMEEITWKTGGEMLLDVQCLVNTMLFRLRGINSAIFHLTKSIV